MTKLLDGSEILTDGGEPLYDVLTGVLAVTESYGADIAVFFAASTIIGTLNATEAIDTASFAGVVLIDGDLAATESSTDLASFVGDIPVVGDLAVSETGADVASFDGTSVIASRLSDGYDYLTDGVGEYLTDGEEVTIGYLDALSDVVGDTAAFVGDVLVAGDLAVAEVSLGSDLVITGDFSSETGWTGVSGSWEITGGQLVNDGSAPLESAVNSFTPDISKTYRYSFDLVAASGSVSNCFVIAGQTFGSDDVGPISFTASGFDVLWLTSPVLGGRTCTIDNLSVKEVISDADTASFAGGVLVKGDLAAVEVGADVAAFIGDTTPDHIGDLAVTEVGADVAALIGATTGYGPLIATEVGADVFASTGVVIPEEVITTGAMAAVEVGLDVAEFYSNVPIQGILSVTESGADVAAFVGDVAIAGIITVTETGLDVAAFIGDIPVTGTLDALSDVGGDTFAAAGVTVLTSTGTLSVTEATIDAAEIVGTVLISGSIEVSETSSDSMAFSGTILVSGAMDVTEASSDTARFRSSSTLDPVKIFTREIQVGLFSRATQTVAFSENTV